MLRKPPVKFDWLMAFWWACIGFGLGMMLMTALYLPVILATDHP